MEIYEFLRSIEQAAEQIDNPKVKADTELTTDTLRRLLMRLMPYREGYMQQPFAEAHKRILKYMIENMPDNTTWVVGDEEYIAFRAMAEDDESLARFVDTRIVTRALPVPGS